MIRKILSSPRLLSPRRRALLWAISSLALTIFSLLVSVSPAAAQSDSANPQWDSQKEWKYVNQGPAKSTEIGNYYLKRKKYKAALSRFQEAVDTDPSFAAAYLGLGKTYEKLGQKQKALESYRKYLELLPSDQDAANAKEVQRAIERLGGARRAL